MYQNHFHRNIHHFKNFVIFASKKNIAIFALKRILLFMHDCFSSAVYLELWRSYFMGY